MPRPSDPLLAAIEGGGTKFVCAVGRGHADVVARARIETADPEATLEAVCRFLAPHRPAAVGLACFGPLELRPGPGQGALLRTPKPAWSGFPLRARLAARLAAPVAVDTDVNAAALAEQRVGAARGTGSCAYVTVGTGLGAGVVVEGRPVHGLLHPELGHLPMPPDPEGFEGTCPFHGGCLEGLVSGPAIRARTGLDPARIPDDAVEPWGLAGRHLAHGLAALVLVASPERIVLGGGVGRRRPLLEAAQRHLRDLLAGYLDRPELDAGIDRYLVAPALAEPGLAGAFGLARHALL